MNTATSVLRKEHDAILRMLEVTEKVAQRLQQNVPVRAEMLMQFLEFFRLFADQCHHGKEEEILFPLLESKGFPRHGGPIGVMLSEHEEGRSLIRTMVESAGAYGEGDRGAGSRWAQAARGYVALLREHIQKENDVLFLMAERLLTEVEQQQLAEAFERLEVERMGAGTHERLHAQMEKLVAELAPAARAS